MLDRTFGWNRGISEIADMLRTGALGMDAVCAWFKVVLEDFGIDANLLMPRVSRLLEALKSL